MSLLCKAYSSASYIKEENKIIFDIHDQKTSITKSRLCSLLGLPQSEDMINLETISNDALLEMFYKMGYKETLSMVSKFHKPNLPPQWNALFTILFKGFSKCITGLDCVSKLFMTLIYGLYIGMNIYFGAVL